MAQYCTKTPETATFTPRQRVAAMIDDLAAKGWQGEHVLQMAERQIVGFSTEHKKLVFWWDAPLTEDQEGEAAQ